MNIVILQGNVGEDPRIKDFESGGKVAQFTLATNKPKRTTREGQEIPEKTTWHNIVVKRSGLAEVCEKYVRKGSNLTIRGEIDTRDYTDSQGIKRYITEIIVEDLHLNGTRDREQAPAPEPEYQPSRPQYGAQPAPPSYQQPVAPAGRPAYQQPYQQPPQNYPRFDYDNDMPEGL